MFDQVFTQKVLIKKIIKLAVFQRFHPRLLGTTVTREECSDQQ